MTGHQERRERMVRMQLEGRGIRDTRVLAAMGRVPREEFVIAGLEEFAYDDTPLPIEEGQTISQPYIVALMIEAAMVRTGERVLEIGTGSGYAAAVLGEIAGEVHTVERHARLAEVARARLDRLGYRHVHAHQGDGSAGWPDAAPFGAILVAAGGPAVPDALLQQLAPDGRLLIPVGEAREQQRLTRIRKRADDQFEEEDLGPVAFVPLIGAHGWREGETAPVPGKRSRAPRRWAAPLSDLVRTVAEPLPDLDDAPFADFIDRFAAARVVLLGEATHGSAEFYRARAHLTRRLIERHGFDFVAVEADWPDAAQLDAHVRLRERARTMQPAFQRFPTWMWRNTEVQDFIDWLRRHNAAIADPARRAAFHGLDLYSLNESIRAVVGYLDRVDPETARTARERYGCLTPWQHDPATYGRAALREGYALCEQAVVAMLRELLDKRLAYTRQDGERFLDAAQNARLVAAAERYYRAMYYGGEESWNLRDRHMFETLDHLLAARGPAAKAVVWAHNSHIGDARATEMGTMRGELNIGQLCRERFGDAAVLVGFGTDHGTVAAATDWDGPMEVKQVRPARQDSIEGLCHEAGEREFLLDFRSARTRDLAEALRAPRLERAIGVIYRPETELMSHYFEAVVPRQFDAWLWFDETHAVTPLPARQRQAEPETYPFGV